MVVWFHLIVFPTFRALCAFYLRKSGKGKYKKEKTQQPYRRNGFYTSCWSESKVHFITTF